MLPLTDSFMGLSMNTNIKTKVYSELDIYIYGFIKRKWREKGQTLDYKILDESNDLDGVSCLILDWLVMVMIWWLWSVYKLFVVMVLWWYFDEGDDVNKENYQEHLGCSCKITREQN